MGKHTARIVLFCLWLMPQPAMAMRAVSTGVCADQWLLALAERDQIAGVSRQAPRSSFSAYAAEAQDIPVHNGSAEEIMALNPDLVLADAFTRRATINTLKRLGLNVVKLPASESLDQWPQMLSDASKALGREEQAALLQRQLQHEWKQLQAPTRGVQPLAAIYRPNGYSSGLKTLPDDTLKRLGVRNLSSELGLPYISPVPLEALVNAEPQYLILDTRPARYDTLGSFMLLHPGLQKFARQSQAIDFPLSAWFCLSPRTLPAALSLRRQLEASL